MLYLEIPGVGERLGALVWGLDAVTRSAVI